MRNYRGLSPLLNILLYKELTVESFFLSLPEWLQEKAYDGFIYFSCLKYSTSFNFALLAEEKQQ